jgi:hypothetical protein
MTIVIGTTTRSSHHQPSKAIITVTVTFGSGDFSANATDQTNLTSFHLDHTVNLMTNITVTENDGGFFIGLVVRIPNGGNENVKSSDVFTAGPGTVVSIPFDEIPEGFYDIVIMSVDGTVAGSFTATWDNLSEDDS